MKDLLIRIWTGKEMIYPHMNDNVCFEYDTLDGWVLSNIDNCTLWSKKISDDPPMLYTGLKDKNGKMIWDLDRISIEYEGKPRTASVFLSVGAFRIDFYKDGVNALNYWSGECEVVGNKYESPDLIRSK